MSPGGVEFQSERRCHAEKERVGEQRPRACCPSGQFTGYLNQETPFSAQDSSWRPYLSSTWQYPSLFTPFQTACLPWAQNTTLSNALSVLSESLVWEFMSLLSHAAMQLHRQTLGRVGFNPGSVTYNCITRSKGL